jgi:hypothetical protein
MAASVSTRVVSWNDAADSHDSVGEARLGDPHDLGATLGGLAALLDHPLVGVAEHLGVGTLAGQEAGVAGLLHADAARHLTHDQLDVLVVDRHTLVAVHLLDLLDEVQLGLADALDLHQLLRVEGAVGERIAGADLLAVGHDVAAAGRQQHGVLVALVVDDRDRDALALVLVDPHDTARTGETGRATRRARLEQLDDARQTTCDVLAGHTAGVEGPHRQLRAGLADRLCGDDADCLAELDRAARSRANGRSTTRRHRAPHRT